MQRRLNITQADLQINDNISWTQKVGKGRFIHIQHLRKNGYG